MQADRRVTKAATMKKTLGLLSFGKVILTLTTFLCCALAFDKTCPKLEEPKTFTPSEYFGTWYAVRGIEHTFVQTEGEITKKQSKKCSEIIIKTKPTKKNEPIWEFSWKTKNKPTKHFTLKQTSTPGLLENSGKGGSFRSLQITNSNDGLWSATLCRFNGNLSTVILSKTPKYEKDKVERITTQISQQGLSVNNIYDRCVS